MTFFTSALTQGFHTEADDRLVDLPIGEDRLPVSIEGGDAGLSKRRILQRSALNSEDRLVLIRNASE
jgi:hypothetical protein